MRRHARNKTLDPDWDGFAKNLRCGTPDCNGRLQNCGVYWLCTTCGCTFRRDWKQDPYGIGWTK